MTPPPCPSKDPAVIRGYRIEGGGLSVASTRIEPEYLHGTHIQCSVCSRPHRGDDNKAFSAGTLWLRSDIHKPNRRDLLRKLLQLLDGHTVTSMDSRAGDQ